MRDGARDVEHMRQALALAEAARRVTPPWPWVGCVLVRDGSVVGAGATGPYPDGPHAEVAAIRAAGDAARGATAYVTLEPCDHHGNTPPCTEALLASGVREVVVACGDPDPKVAGRGIARLRAAGVPVTVGVAAGDVGWSLLPYLQHRRTGRSYAVLKTAASLDGRVTAADGSSRWITGEAARRDVHRLRAESQAVVVGSGTALADRPALTVRDAPAPPRAPLRVLLDGTGRVPAAGPLFDAELGPTLVCTTDHVARGAAEAWLGAGAKVETLPPGVDGRGVDPVAVLHALAGLGVLQVLLEGGPAIHAAFLAADAVDLVVAYVAPRVLGTGGRLAWDVAGPATLAASDAWHMRDATRLGDDVRLTYVPGGFEAAQPGRVDR